MRQLPLISVITPTLNSAKTIDACLKSVIDQTYKNIEVLIIDGLSTDGTLEIVRRYQTQISNIKLLSETDNGIYDAMNKGIFGAKGEWIFFLGSDDTLYNEDVFSSLLPLLSDVKLKVIYGNIITKSSGMKYDGKFNSFKLLNRNICHQSIFARKSVFDKLGKFDINYKSLADWHFNMKWFNDRDIRHKYTDKVIVCFNENGYAPNNPDLKFLQDWDFNTTRCFSKISRKIYKHRDKKIVLKILNILWNV